MTLNDTSGIGPIPLQRESGKRPYQQIRDHIIGCIAAGAWQGGQRLPSVRDWAQATGVAYQTMSRAIRDLADAGILEASPRRGTRVASRAPGRRARTGAVGVAFTSALEEPVPTSRFFAALLPDIEHELLDHHSRIIRELIPRDRPLASMFDHLRLVDGFAAYGGWAGRLTPEFVEQVKQVDRLGTPVVLVNSGLDDPDVCIVRSDNLTDSREAIKQLAAMGHERIGCWTVPNDLRHAGYVDGLKDTGLPYREEYDFQCGHEELVQRMVMMRERPTALFVGHSFGKLPEIVLALRRLGIEPGRDLYFCAYDENLWNMLTPFGFPFARIDQPIAELSWIVARVLLGRIEGKPVPHLNTAHSTFVRVNEPGS